MGDDKTLEFQRRTLEAKYLKFTSDVKVLGNANCYIITVSTLSIFTKIRICALKIDESVGNFLETGDLVIYESTVYPGATDMRPILEKASGLMFNKDFCGYSPERIPWG